jgi:hypothetical protein
MDERTKRRLEKLDRLSLSLCNAHEAARASEAAARLRARHRGNQDENVVPRGAETLQDALLAAMTTGQRESRDSWVIGNTCAITYHWTPRMGYGGVRMGVAGEARRTVTLHWRLVPGAGWVRDRSMG